MAKILLTGGCGYIGSHTAVELINAGRDVVIADDLSNSDKSVIDRIEMITGKRPDLCVSDLKDKKECEKIFDENDISAVIHFAGYKAVGESVLSPLKYYRNNLDSTLSLLESMRSHLCNTIIFSSSATVYGTDGVVPYTESAETGGCSNPYGWTKFMIERIICDTVLANPDMSAVNLRYFNPIGAHESGLIGENPSGIPNNLMPYITQVASGIRDHLNIYGNDYDTPDGTGVRDYIHVVDLAKGHLAALEYAEKHKGTECINLGTGVGYSVLDVVNAFNEANHLDLPYVFAKRREGDLASYYANPKKAYELLGWKAEKTLVDMCKDSWRWQVYLKNSENKDGGK